GEPHRADPGDARHGAADAPSDDVDPRRARRTTRDAQVTHALQINEIEAARERLGEVRREVGRVFIGDTAPVDLMLVALLSRGHVLLEGVPGIAKTTLVKAFGAALGCTIR